MSGADAIQAAKKRHRWHNDEEYKLHELERHRKWAAKNPDYKKEYYRKNRKQTVPLLYDHVCKVCRLRFKDTRKKRVICNSKQCKRELTRQYSKHRYHNDIERSREKGRQYYTANREKMLQHAKEYRRKNPEKYKEYQRRWYALHPEARKRYALSLEKQRENSQKYRLRNREAYRLGIELGIISPPRPNNQETRTKLGAHVYAVLREMLNL